VAALLLTMIGCMDTLLPALSFQAESNQVAVGHVTLDAQTTWIGYEVIYAMEDELEATYERAQLEMDIEVTNTQDWQGMLTLWLFPEEWSGGLVPSSALEGSTWLVEAVPDGETELHARSELFVPVGVPGEVMHIGLTMDGSAALTGTAAFTVRAWYPDAVDEPWIELQVL